MNFEDRKNMTLQQVFDQVLSEARKDPRRCVSPTGKCLYRKSALLVDNSTNLDNLAEACWIGRLIPDENYTPDMEGNGVYWSSVLNATGFHEDHVELLQDLQNSHDSSFHHREPRFLVRRLMHVAKRHYLKYNPDPAVGF